MKQITIAVLPPRVDVTLEITQNMFMEIEKLPLVVTGSTTIFITILCEVAIEGVKRLSL